MVELSTLRVFLAAAEERNFSQAARRLNMSQSAVSQNIQTMEQIYNVELFVRRGRSVALSEAGEAILPLAREVLRAARLMEDNLKNIETHEIGGDLLIGCSTSAGKYLMPTLLSMFQDQYPAVRPRVKLMPRESIFERLLNQTLPMGASGKLLEHRDIECQSLYDERIMLVAPADHPWAARGKATLSELPTQRIILREEVSGTCETVMQGLRTHGITPDMLNVVMELGNPEAIEMAVERGVGVAFVSEMVAARGLAFGRIKEVKLEGLDLHRMVNITRNVNYPLTRAQTLFWEFAIAQREALHTEMWNSLVSSSPNA